MSTPVVSVRPDTPLDDAAHLLVRHEIGAMPVVDDDAHLVGLVTQSDVFRGLAIRLGIGLSHTAHLDPHRGPSKVSDVTHRTAAWVTPGDSDRLCLLRMVSHDGRSLVVLDRGKIVGIISRRDAIDALARQISVGEPTDAASVHEARSIDLGSWGDLQAASTGRATL